VGGLVGANALAGSYLSHDDLIEMATELEGHPDNVVPALIGGCRLAASKPDSGWTVCDVPWHPDIVPIVAVPNFELSTTDARRVLPLTYDRRDTIFNAAHLGLLLRGLQTGQAEWLTTALQDRIHQPYRQHLIPGYAAVQSAALQAGAYGLVISGAGPTLLALAHPNHAPAVQTTMQQAWEVTGMTVQTHILPIETQGTVVQTA
jgi:homoserine kinase